MRSTFFPSTLYLGAIPHHLICKIRHHYPLKISSTDGLTYNCHSSSFKVNPLCQNFHCWQLMFEAPLLCWKGNSWHSNRLPTPITSLAAITSYICPALVTPVANQIMLRLFAVLNHAHKKKKNTTHTHNLSAYICIQTLDP